MSYDPAPLSKTAKYKKITKPLLERKRRARINRCLDELKDLMVGALEIDDDNLSKLEKADILELTVNHLTKLHSPKDPVLEAKKFEAGFGQCAAEACRFIMSVPDLDSKVSQNLISHLSRLITAQPLTIQVPERPPFSPPTSPSSMISDRQHYYSDHERSSPDAEDTNYSIDGSSSHNWPGNNSLNNNASHHTRNKQSPPLSGLLTTVDKLAPHNYRTDDQVNVQRSPSYMNRQPTEKKDVILQKIRQHIMDKRGNDVHSQIEHAVVEQHYSDDAYAIEQLHSYPSNNNDTLDLRKVRSPTKFVDNNQTDQQAVYHNMTRSVTVPLPNENKVEMISNVPEHCELPMDYSNLPPKKKRKLLEYQYKKQEEARRRKEVFYSEKKVNLDGDMDHDIDGSAWRPW